MKFFKKLINFSQISRERVESDLTEINVISISISIRGILRSVCNVKQKLNC